MRKSSGFSVILMAAMAFVSNLNAQDSTSAWVKQFETPQYFAVLVSDVDVSVDWYLKVFGLVSVGGSADENGEWRIENLRNDYLHVEIIQDDRASKSKRPLGFFKVGFSVPNVVRVADRVEAASGERPRVIDIEQFDQRLIQIRDPDGNTIQLSSSLND